MAISISGWLSDWMMSENQALFSYGTKTGCFLNQVSPCKKTFILLEFQAFSVYFLQLPKERDWRKRQGLLISGATVLVFRAVRVMVVVFQITGLNPLVWGFAEKQERVFDLALARKTAFILTYLYRLFAICMNFFATPYGIIPNASFVVEFSPFFHW